MPSSSSRSISQLLAKPVTSDSFADLISATYGELRHVAARYFQREALHHSLAPTALVHEAYVRLIKKLPTRFHNRGHYFGIMSRAMRQILIENFRRRTAIKRDIGNTAVPLDEVRLAMPVPPDYEAIEAALKELERLDPRMAEIINLRFYAGLQHQEIADVMGISESLVRREWSLAKAWLQSKIPDPSL